MGARVANTRATTARRRRSRWPTPASGAGRRTAHAGIAAARVVAIFNWPGVPDALLRRDRQRRRRRRGHGPRHARGRRSSVGAGDAAGRGPRHGAGGEPRVPGDRELRDPLARSASLFYGLSDGYYLVGIPADIGDPLPAGLHRRRPRPLEFLGQRRVGRLRHGDASERGRLHLESPRHGDHVLGGQRGRGRRRERRRRSELDQLAGHRKERDRGRRERERSRRALRLRPGAQLHDLRGPGRSEPDLHVRRIVARSLPRQSIEGRPGGGQRRADGGVQQPRTHLRRPDQAGRGGARHVDALGILRSLPAAATTRRRTRKTACINTTAGGFRRTGELQIPWRHLDGCAPRRRRRGRRARLLSEDVRPPASAALVKATLVNSAVDLLDENNDGIFDNAIPIPNMHEGWGRVDLAGATDGSRQFVDEGAGLSTGGTQTFTVRRRGGDAVQGDAAPGPTTVGTTSATKILVNDLDLEVSGPGGVFVQGQRVRRGWSVDGRAARQHQQPGERLRAVPCGWHLDGDRSGLQRAQGPQPFALVVAGQLSIASSRRDLDRRRQRRRGQLRHHQRRVYGTPCPVSRACPSPWTLRRQNGTAVAGSDYAAAAGTLTFTPSQTSQTISVNVNGDTAVEADETFFVNLVNPSGATIADGQRVGTISNDDTAPPAPEPVVWTSLVGVSASGKSLTKTATSASGNGGAISTQQIVSGDRYVGAHGFGDEHIPDDWSLQGEH